MDQININFILKMKNFIMLCLNDSSYKFYENQTILLVSDSIKNSFMNQVISFSFFVFFSSFGHFDPHKPETVTEKINKQY